MCNYGEIGSGGVGNEKLPDWSEKKHRLLRGHGTDAVGGVKNKPGERDAHGAKPSRLFN